MKTDRREFGDWGEKVAAWYLQKKGYRVIDKNVQFRDGEIDLVALKDGLLIFVEIKTRKTAGFGSVSAINQTKQNRIRRAAIRFCKQEGLSAATQFDAVVIIGSQESKEISIQHFRNCF